MSPQYPEFINYTPPAPRRRTQAKSSAASTSKPQDSNQTSSLVGDRQHSRAANKITDTLSSSSYQADVVIELAQHSSSCQEHASSPTRNCSPELKHDKPHLDLRGQDLENSDAHKGCSEANAGSATKPTEEGLIHKHQEAVVNSQQSGEAVKTAAVDTLCPADTETPAMRKRTRSVPCNSRSITPELDSISIPEQGDHHSVKRQKPLQQQEFQIDNAAATISTPVSHSTCSNKPFKPNESSKDIMAGIPSHDRHTYRDDTQHTATEGVLMPQKHVDHFDQHLGDYHENNTIAQSTRGEENRESERAYVTETIATSRRDSVTPLSFVNNRHQSNPGHQIVDLVRYTLPRGGSIITTTIHCKEPGINPTQLTNRHILGEQGRIIRVAKLSADSWMLIGYELPHESGTGTAPNRDQKRNEFSNNVIDDEQMSDESDKERGRITGEDVSRRRLRGRQKQRHKPSLKNPWLKSEDRRLIRYKEREGLDWAQIFPCFPGRTKGAIRTRYYVIR